MNSPTPTNFNRPVIRSNGGSGNKTMQIVLFIILLGVVAMVGYQLLKGGDNPDGNNAEDTTPTSTEEVEVTATAELEPTATVEVTNTPTPTKVSAGTSEVSANITTTVPGNWKPITEIASLDYNFYRQKPSPCARSDVLKTNFCVIHRSKAHQSLIRSNFPTNPSDRNPNDYKYRNSPANQ